MGALRGPSLFDRSSLRICVENVSFGIGKGRRTEHRLKVGIERRNDSDPRSDSHVEFRV